MADVWRQQSSPIASLFPQNTNNFGQASALEGEQPTVRHHPQPVRGRALIKNVVAGAVELILIQRATATAMVFVRGEQACDISQKPDARRRLTCVLKRGGSFAGNPVYLAVSNLLCMKIKWSRGLRSTSWGTAWRSKYLSSTLSWAFLSGSSELISSMTALTWPMMIAIKAMATIFTPIRKTDAGGSVALDGTGTQKLAPHGPVQREQDLPPDGRVLAALRAGRSAGACIRRRPSRSPSY